MRTQSTNPISLTMTAILIAGAAASCAKVEAEIPDTKVTQKSVSFQGVPGAQAAGEVSITQSFTLTSDDLSWVKDLNADVYAYEVELKAVSGVQDLSFIHYARITMTHGDDSTVPAVEVINYQRPDNFTPSPVLDVKTTYPINVSSVWAAKKVVLTMELAGIFPEQEWAADVTLHMSGKLSYTF
jgi:hypothetical protein